MKHHQNVFGCESNSRLQNPQAIKKVVPVCSLGTFQGAAVKNVRRYLCRCWYTDFSDRGQIYKVQTTRNLQTTNKESRIKKLVPKSLLKISSTRSCASVCNPKQCSKFWADNIQCAWQLSRSFVRVCRFCLNSMRLVTTSAFGLCLCF